MTTDNDLAFFILLARKGSFSAAALELGLSTPAVSKRLMKLENRLGIRLMHRTTRRVSLTSEGEAYLEGAKQIQGEIEELEQRISQAGENPKGLLRINATFGFGREHVARIVPEFRRLHPEVEIQLVLTDAPLNLVEEGYDLGIRFGAPLNSRLISRKILANRRFLCASPSYLERHGAPSRLSDLAQHECIILRQDNQSYDVWRLQRGQKTESVKVQGRLSSNDGAVALNWVLEGEGIMLRSEWDISRHIAADRLRLVLPKYAQVDAEIYAVYPERNNVSAKVRAFIQFLSNRIGTSAPASAM